MSEPGMHDVPPSTVDGRRTTGVGGGALGSAPPSANQVAALTGPTETESPNHPGTDATGLQHAGAASLAEKRSRSNAELSPTGGQAPRPPPAFRSAVAADDSLIALPATAAQHMAAISTRPGQNANRQQAVRNGEQLDQRLIAGADAMIAESFTEEDAMIAGADAIIAAHTLAAPASAPVLQPAPAPAPAPARTAATAAAPAATAAAAPAVAAPPAPAPAVDPAAFNSLLVGMQALTASVSSMISQHTETVSTLTERLVALEPQSDDTATPAKTVAAATDKTRTSAAAAIIQETLKSCSNLLHSEAQLSATTAALDPVNISEDLTVRVPTAAGQAVRKGKPFQLKPACKQIQANLFSEGQAKLNQAHRIYQAAIFKEIKWAKQEELTAVKNLLAETLATAKTDLKSLLDTTPALPPAVVEAENQANLRALNSKWEKRQTELLTKKTAEKTKANKKREQVEQAKLKKLVASNKDSLQAGVVRLQDKQEEKIVQKYGLTVVPDYDEDDDRDVSDGQELSDQLTAAQATQKDAQRLTSQLTKQLAQEKSNPKAKKKSGQQKQKTPVKRKKPPAVKPKGTPPSGKKKQQSTKNGKGRSVSRGRSKKRV